MCSSADTSSDDEAPVAHKAPPLTILVVDDSEDVRTSMRLRLEMEGVAHDGLSGLDAALRIRPDVILIDIAMPGIDGDFQPRRCSRMT